METPLDGMNTPSEVGQRVIDKPELPPGGITTDSEVYTEVNGKPFPIECITRD